jgi:hypothetical protein
MDKYSPGLKPVRKPSQGFFANPTAWLLEPENPSVRYWTLTDLLDRPADDADVRAAHAAIPTYPPVAELLAAQKQDGYWVKRDFYLPKNYGTFWVLSVLADLGLTAENAHIRQGCEFLFAHQREHGAFCRRRRIRGQGIVWETQPDACTHARIVRFLIQAGYAADPRTRAAIDWLLRNQRDDAMWLCDRSGRHGCLRATLDVLRAAALDPETAARAEIARAAAVVADLLMEPRMGRYHVGDPSAPPKVAAALEYLLSRQVPDGTWPLDQSAPRPPFDVGQPGQPNKWLTLDACRVIKRLSHPGSFLTPRRKVAKEL